MPHYFVIARPIEHKLEELRRRLDMGEIQIMQPFGPALHASLTGSRRLITGTAAWEEEDFCRPPLAQERAAVLDRYFTELRVHPIQRGAGWSVLARLPSMWDLPAGIKRG